MARIKSLSPEQLAQAAQMTKEFNDGASFANLCKKYLKKNTEVRILLTEYARHMARQGSSTQQQNLDGRTHEIAVAASQRTINELFDSDTLREMVLDEVRKFPPQTGKLDVTINKGVEKVRIEQSHAMLKEALRRIGAGFTSGMLVGPAGSGKTTLARQVAKALKRKFGFISLTGGTTEGALIGRMSSLGKYIPSSFVERFEDGGVFLLDEVDAADANVLLVLNAALANGMLAVPSRPEKPIARRHPDFILLCAANTWGTGADWQYVGRNQLDAAFLSRFAGFVLEVNYDEVLERSLVTEDWFTSFSAVRAAAQISRLRRVLGTRELLAGYRLRKAEYTEQETWKALTIGWTPDEVNKARIPQ